MIINPKKWLLKFLLFTSIVEGQNFHSNSWLRLWINPNLDFLNIFVSLIHSTYRFLVCAATIKGL